jgi:Outer membrane protein beta-barrel domain
MYPRWRFALVMLVIVLLAFSGTASAKFFKKQQRKGLAVGPRFGVFMPQDEDISSDISMMAQTGLDFKAFVIPWIGINFGFGVAAGGGTGTEQGVYDERDEDGELTGNTKTRELDTYRGLMIVPATLGLSFEALPRSVFDPYVGGGVGYYIVGNVYPLVDDLPAEYEGTRAPVKFDRAGVVGFYGQVGLDVKFHDYLGAKLEGTYHMIEGGESLDNADLSGIMISLGSFVYF